MEKIMGNLTELMQNWEKMQNCGRNIGGRVERKGKRSVNLKFSQAEQMWFRPAFREFRDWGLVTILFLSLRGREPRTRHRGMGAVLYARQLPKDRSLGVFSCTEYLLLVCSNVITDQLSFFLLCGGERGYYLRYLINSRWSVSYWRVTWIYTLAEPYRELPSLVN